MALAFGRSVITSRELSVDVSVKEVSVMITENSLQKTLMLPAPIRISFWCRTILNRSIMSFLTRLLRSITLGRLGKIVVSRITTST